MIWSSGWIHMAINAGVTSTAARSGNLEEIKNWL